MEELEKIQTEIPEDICTIQIDYYGRKLAIGVITGKIYIFESNQDTMIKTSEIISHFGPIYELSWSHPSFGPLLASSGFDKKVILYKIDNDRIEEIYSHKNHDNIVKTLKFCPSSNKLLLISGCLNGYIVTCEYYNKDFILNKLFAHDFGVNAIDFLDDNNFITCGNDNSIKIWNYSQQDGKVEIQKILELKDEINNMSTYDLSCKDDKHFVCCGESNGEGVVNYWILKEGKWEVKEICRSKEKFEKIKFNEEHTCMAVIDQKGEENIIFESEL
jgi:protein transport protein SEC13